MRGEPEPVSSYNGIGMQYAIVANYTVEVHFNSWIKSDSVADTCISSYEYLWVNSTVAPDDSPFFDNSEGSYGCAGTYACSRMYIRS